jgi:death-on-curing protein
VTEPRWLERRIIVAVHDVQLARHGGAGWLRDSGLLDLARARPPDKFACGEGDPCALAVAFAGGIVRNHPFVGGNERTAFIAAALFLSENRLHLDAPEAEAVVMTLVLASGELPEGGFAAWLRHRSRAA